MILGIDHVLIAVDSVESSTLAFERLGFEVHRGGEHPAMGTHNALVPLACGAYLELIGVRDRARAERTPITRRVLEALAGDHRLAGFALDTDDIDRDVTAVRARGLDIDEPIPGQRVRPDGQPIAWRFAMWQRGDMPFLIQDLTPRALRVPVPRLGLGSAARLAGVVVGVDDPGAAHPEWAGLLGLKPAGFGFGLGRGSIRLEPRQARAAGLASVELQVQDLEHRRRDLPVAISGARPDRIELDPRHTAGAPLVLHG